MMAWLRCWVRSRHDPVRQPLGWFRCADCGETGLDLDEMGFEGEGYVATDRRLYSREHPSATRTA
jgi:hypothetical protein